MAARGTIWKITKWVLRILLALVLIFFLIFVPWFFTHLLTTSRYHFPDSNDSKTPKEFGMDEYSPVVFPSIDNISLSGWYIPAHGEAKGSIVYCHGQNRSRVEMLPMAQFGHSLGYNGLLFDFRHQGASGGEISTIGYQERLDVEGAIRRLEQQKGARPLIVWGVSMGAAASLMAAAETPGIAAVISDSTFLSFSDTINHHWRLFFPWLPPFPIAYEVRYLWAWRGGFRPSQFDLRKAVQRINPRPILFVAVVGDRRMPPDIARTLYALSTSPDKALVVLPGTRHGEGFQSGQQQYEQAVTAFLAKVAGQRPATTDK